MNLFETISTDSAPFPTWYYYFSIGIAALGFLMTVFYLVKIFYQTRKVEMQDLSSSFWPMRILVLALASRQLMYLIISLITFTSDNSEQLRYSSIYQTLPWIFVYASMHFLISRIIRVPDQRKKYKTRLLRLNFVALMGLLIIGALGFVDLITGIAAMLVAVVILSVTIILWLIYSRMKREAKFVTSKLTNARMKVISYGLAAMAMSYMLIPVVIILSIADQYTVYIKALNLFVSVSLTVVATMAFYFTFFIPDFVKRRSGLLVPDSSLI